MEGYGLDGDPDTGHLKQVASRSDDIWVNVTAMGQIVAPDPAPAGSSVLLVEDSDVQARLTMRMIDRARPDGLVSVTHAVTLAEAYERLEQAHFDCVLLDLNLPDAKGLEALEAIRRTHPWIALVVLTGLEDEGLDMAVLRAGAQGYLSKRSITGAGISLAIADAIQRAHIFEQFEDVRVSQLQMKDDVLSHVSHELRTPLAAIHDFVSILLDGLDGALEPRQEEHLQIVFRNVRHLDSMVKDLLDASKAQVGKLSIELQCTSAAQSVARVVDTMSKNAVDGGIELASIAAHDLPPVFADPLRLDQILINLVHNAVKFTPTGGRVTVGAELSEVDPGFVRLFVADTGTGIEARDIPKVFERLRQLDTAPRQSRKGLGLGLYIAKQLVTGHGGRIWVESTPGKGSTFLVTLPVFSLESLLAPTLAKKGGPSCTVAVLTLDLVWSEHVSAEIPRKVLEEVRSVLRDNTLAHDVVLPNISGTDDAGLLFLVASVDNLEQARIVATRIKEALVVSESLARHNIKPTVEVTLVSVGSDAIESTWAETLKAAAGAVEGVVTTTLSQARRSQLETTP